MSYSHSELLNRFKKGKKSGRSHSMYIDGDVLYSYGRHFPLLVKTNFGYLMNGDKYSSTTSRHQSICASTATIIIPFSILSRAAIHYKRITLIDKEEERWDERTYIDKETGEEKTVSERRPDSCIIQDEGGRCWLSSMDNGSYFMSRLPNKCKTVSEAFASLRPLMAQGKEGEDYFRQGEWFFIPLKRTLFSDMKVVNITKGRRKVKTHPNYDHFRYEPAFFLTNKNPDQQPHHFAYEYGEIEGCPYPLVRSSIQHQNGDHPVLRLGKEWHLAIESNHIISYGAGGRVD